MEVFMGTILPFGFNFAPEGWSTCQGQKMSIAQYTALYALMGTYYGGDGQTTFGLPDLQGRTIVGQGNNGTSSYDMGETGGNANIILSQLQLPAHNHVAKESGGAVSVSAPIVEDTGESDTPSSGSILAGTSIATNIYSTKTPTGHMAPGTGTITNLPIQLTAAGGSQSVDVESPYLAMNYCIAIQGYFPSRN